jgi:hypothetical protein
MYSAWRRTLRQTFSKSFVNAYRANREGHFADGIFIPSLIGVDTYASRVDNGLLLPTKMGVAASIERGYCAVGSAILN